MVIHYDELEYNMLLTCYLYVFNVNLTYISSKNSYGIIADNAELKPPKSLNTGCKIFFRIAYDCLFGARREMLQNSKENSPRVIYTAAKCLTTQK